MLINFLDPIFKPELECDSVASEGYEVSNLISNDPQLSNQGFLAERFISSPVVIKVKLVCPIDMKRVQICTRVSNQKSLGIEVSVRQTTQRDDQQDYQRVASVVIPNHMEGVVFEVGGRTADYPPNFHRRTIYGCRNHKYVTELCLKIFKFQYVAAVKRIEIWGQPSRFCDRETKQRVYSLWNRKPKLRNPTDIPVSLNPYARCVESRSHVSDPVVPDECPIPDTRCAESESHASGLVIPEEFRDEITCEIMTLPMILPSGKVVDQRTLERFEKEEAQWNRPPSDPFTGLPFCDGRKPVVATALKLTIDSFCARNSNLGDIKTQPRRLGCQNEYAQPCVRVSELIRSNHNSNRGSAPYAAWRKAGFVRKRSPPAAFRKAPKTASFSRRCIQCEKSNVTDMYKLPCSHIVCRCCLTKSANECYECKLNFASSDVEKIHIFDHVV